MSEPVADRLRADVAVIGSGPGGSVTATLCAEAGYSTLLVEEGPDLPLDAMAHFSGEEILHKYRHAGVTMAFGNPSITYVEGRCVGGGSEVNRGLYHRTPPYVLEQWAGSHHVDALTPEALAPHFEACEATARIAALPGTPPPLSQRLGEGAMRLGWDAIAAHRLYDYETGRKQSMSATFVPRFRQAGGRVIADMRAQRIRRINGRWEVTARHRSTGSVTIVADALFVACGAVQTPALLRRSGIRHNIGDSLRFHPMLKAVALFDTPVNRLGDPDPVHQIKMFEPRFGIGCSISSPAMLALALAANPPMRARIAADAARMGLYYVQNGTGHGRVRTLPGCHDPVVSVCHEQAELDQLYDGLQHLIRALFAAGAQAVQPCMPGFAMLRSVEDMATLPECLPRKSAMLTSVHVFASCPMGEDRRLSATDSWGRIHDADGLRIADASLMCGPTIANPQGSVMAIAHRNALHAIARRFA
ncbi:GMC family oxidoreductase [Sphingobium estronivorans]|uniref:GMC family oxidoreductase n=1 Tax=Sphingobium estronivorans TaxID=1577690 RepID=UPI001239477F|nr:GMC family oxidoreductase [Sphingobium estronivorans]